MNGDPARLEHTGRFGESETMILHMFQRGRGKNKIKEVIRERNPVGGGTDLEFRDIGRLPGQGQSETLLIFPMP